MRTHRKQGSALLIVLGFLSFMVVSAVAFAIYMRAERRPSSAFRRVAATRHLVKAALAEAISRVDDAVRDDPFPGLCATNNNGAALDPSRSYTFADSSQAMDVWHGRVFMPPSHQGKTTDAETRFAPADETVSVLTLEGLGYLPPSLVNDVRFLSRSSWAAAWQQLPFDAGRFAYCAVNVSDFLDVNRLAADKPRTAEAKNRLSLAHLFDTGFDPLDAMAATVSSGSVENPAGNGGTFDGKTKDGVYVPGDAVPMQQGVGNTAPYVSLLDYNLALDASWAPEGRRFFRDWLDGTMVGGDTYYNESVKEEAAKSPFITDTWRTNETWDVDISTAAGQPFSKDLLEQKAGPELIQKVWQYGGGFSDAVFKELYNRGVQFLLYDYLDHDDVPLSPVMPCVERVPMLTGLKWANLLPAKKWEFLNPPETKTEEGTQTDYMIKSDWFRPSLDLEALIVFPFRDAGLRPNDPKKKYKAQAFMRFVLVAGDLSWRLNSQGTIADLLRPKDDEWQQLQGKMSAFSDDGFWLSAASEVKEFSIKDICEDPPTKEDECGWKTRLMFRFEDLSERPFFTKTTPKSQGGMNSTATPPSPTYTIKTFPLKVEGDQYSWLWKGEGPKNELPDVPLVPYVCVWVRILDNDGNVVDLVPTGVEDTGGPSFLTPWENLGGTGQPLLRFQSNVSLNLKDLKDGGVDVSGGENWTPKSLYAVDPRINNAPEFWFNVEGDVDFTTWLGKVHDFMKLEDDRDQDIFMFVSNQGVLQSLGEWAFLPSCVDRVPGDPQSVNNDGYPADIEKQDSVIAKCAWRTHRSSDVYEDFASTLTRKSTSEDSKSVGRSNEKECLVNPHTDNLGVMMAALANTPMNYWASAQGVDDNVTLFESLRAKPDETVKTFSNYKKYAFNAANASAKLTYKELVQVAKTFMTAMGGLELPASDEVAKNLVKFNGDIKAGEQHNAVARLLKEKIRNGVPPSAVWQTVWDDLWALNWDKGSDFFMDATDELFGVPLSEPLYGVDRKFLYSYWRDCFANNQQLFLIFVRAESSALGGPGEGTPAQQGGRAVALVWRDPDASEGNGSSGRDRDVEPQYNEEKNRQRPHRTRILFYHQFD